MKVVPLFFILLALIVALGIGWFIDKPPILSSKNPLQVPDNIDYYFSDLNFSAFGQDGELSYQLKSPYLEHYIREDTSQISAPDIRYFGDNNKWQLSAMQGLLQHKGEIFELIKQARIHRIDAKDPLILTSEQIIFTPDAEQVVVPQKLRVKTNSLNLHADYAVMNLKNNQHEFRRVKAVYDLHSKI